MGESTSDYKALFDEFDVDGDGVINAMDLTTALRMRGQEANEDDILRLIAMVDADNSSTIDFEEFQQFMRLSSFWLHSQTPGRTRFIHLNATVETALLTLLAGGVAGMVSRSVVAPLERIKILFQTQGRPPKYTSVSQALAKILREEGYRGFYKGNGVNCLRIFPSSGMQFLAYEQYKAFALRNFFTEQSDLTAFQRFIVGGMAGITSLVAVYPLEFARARITVQTEAHYKGIIDCWRKVVKAEGVTALYRGLWPSIVGVVPYVGIDFAVYETLKEYVPKRKDGTVNSVNTLLCGAVAGVAGQTIAYPLDLIRRRLQVQGFQKGAVNPNLQYKGILDAFGKIYRAEGVRGLYAGLAPNYLKVVPSIAVSFLCYERLKTFFNIKKQH